MSTTITINNKRNLLKIIVINDSCEIRLIYFKLNEVEKKCASDVVTNSHFGII